MSEHDSTCALPELPKVTGVQFRYIEGWPGYCIGDDGSVWSCRKIRRRDSITRGGFTWGVADNWKRRKTQSYKDYHMVELRNNNRRRNVYVHRLVLEAFRGPCPTGMESCHNNGVRSDCRLVNLRWDTKKSNCDDRRLHGHQMSGERHHSARLTDFQVSAIRRAYSSNIVTLARIADWFGVSRSLVGGIVRQSHRPSHP